MKREVKFVMSEPAWRNHWKDEGHIADFDRVETTMKQLFCQKQYEAVIEIAQVFIDEAKEYVESCNDDGDSAWKIQNCMEIAFKALTKSNWPDLKKIQYSIEAILNDDYEIFRNAHDVLKSVQDLSAWSKMADKLFEQLNELQCKSPKGRDDFYRSYGRDRISNLLIYALEKADRSQEILPLCEEEAWLTDSWERYVHHLVKAKQYKKARTVAEEGIHHLGNSYPGITHSLRKTIAKLASDSGDFSSILLLKQEDFLNHPDLSTYQTLLDAANKTKNVDEMKLWAIQFLDSGKAPAKGALKSAFQDDSEYAQYPHYEALISIAINEKRIEDVLSLYRKVQKKDCYFRSDHQVASAIETKYPDGALKIWRGLAEDCIAQTNPSAYNEAAGYLKSMMKVYLKTKRNKEWTEYLSQLKESNKRKTRFIRTLRGLIGEKIVSN